MFRYQTGCCNHQSAAIRYDCLPGFTILRNRVCSSDPNRSGRWNLYRSAGRNYQFINGCNRLAKQYTGYIYNYLFIQQWNLQQYNTRTDTINALPTATITYPGSPYCAT